MTIQIANGFNKDTKARDREISVQPYSNLNLLYLETKPSLTINTVDEETPEDLNHICLDVEDAIDLAYAILEGVRIVKLNKRLLLMKEQTREKHFQ